MVTLGNGTGVDSVLLIFAANQLRTSCVLRFCSSSTVCDIAAARSCSSFSIVSSSTATFFLHDIVLHHIRHDKAIATYGDDEHKDGLIVQFVHNIVQPGNIMAHHWHCHQRQRSTDIHRPNLRLVAYGRDVHEQGKDERQCAEAECQ